MREIMDHCPGAKLVLIGLKSDLRPDLKFSSQGAGVENEGEDQIDRKEKIEETEEKGPIQLVEIEEKRISINAAQYMSTLRSSCSHDELRWAADVVYRLFSEVQ